MNRTFRSMTPDEAAALIEDGSQVALSGFTVSGTPKAIPRAMAAHARSVHARGKSWRIRLLTGASTGPVDDQLAEAQALSWRAPFQSSKPLRDQINAGTTAFADLHLSHVPQYIEFGFAGVIDWAIVEATEVTPDGRVYLTTGVGITPTILKHAKRVLIEINEAAAPRVREMHDLALLPPPPNRTPIPIQSPGDRIGLPYATVDPRKIVGVVRSSEVDGVPAFDPPSAESQAIAGHIVRFLAEELQAGRIPREFLPVQAGVGNVSNAVMAAFGKAPEIPRFDMYTEVMQDAQVALVEQDRIGVVSTCALAVSDECAARVMSRIDDFAPRVILRPQELSNNPGVIRRLGVIAINTVLEFDIYGHANSTHVAGTQMMNGIGGSGDFTRNAYLSILMAPSTAKGGKISTAVPMVSHCDHAEHSVNVIVTEQGLADLRGLGPNERAQRIINTCAHPDYREMLQAYVRDCKPGHLRHNLARAFEMHTRLATTGSMKG
jgi:acetyl-CoA hydrolase